MLKNAGLDALEADMDFKSNSVPSYLQPDKETDLDSELNLPAAPSGHAAITANRQQVCQLGDLLVSSHIDFGADIPRKKPMVSVIPM